MFETIKYAIMIIRKYKNKHIWEYTNIHIGKYNVRNVKAYKKKAIYIIYKHIYIYI